MNKWELVLTVGLSSSSIVLAASGALHQRWGNQKLALQRYQAAQQHWVEANNCEPIFLQLQLGIINGILGQWETALDHFAAICRKIQNAETVVEFLGIESESHLIPVVAFGYLGSCPAVRDAQRESADFQKEVLAMVNGVGNNRVTSAIPVDIRVIQ